MFLAYRHAIRMAKRMKLGRLESCLQELKTLDCPDVRLEQYQTPPHIAAKILWEIDTHFGGINGKSVLDLGCGCGILGLGSLFLGATNVVGVDIDQRAIDIALENAKQLDKFKEKVTFIRCDIQQIDEMKLGGLHFDTVIMNPPFGTQENAGIDAIFIEKALMLGNTVYSMHKTSTRKFWVKKSKEWNVKMNPIFEIRFNIDHTYEFHTETSRDVKVDLLQFIPAPKI